MIDEARRKTELGPILRLRPQTGKRRLDHLAARRGRADVSRMKTPLGSHERLSNVGPRIRRSRSRRSLDHSDRCRFLSRFLPLPAAFLLQACTLVGGSATASGPPEPPPAAWTQTGVASWYGEPFHGRETASGEVYDMNELTCAHRTLPFGTRLRVQNLENGRAVTVRVNDRGPFVDGRILDVSRKAAQDLGIIGPGKARVRLTLLGADRR